VCADAPQLERELAARRGLMWRIRVEEPVLSIPAYAEYARRQARLVPGVW
jgi:hypothetical protein